MCLKLKLFYDSLKMINMGLYLRVRPVKECLTWIKHSLFDR